MRMLWAGLGEYIAKNKITIIFGVASWVGQSPVESAQAISYLYYNHLSPLSLRATVLTEKFADEINPKLSQMNILPRVFVDEEKARRQMTPLIKGYLRLGATFGKGVFVDAPFNTYDVFVMMQSKKIAAVYQKHFAGSENAFDHLGVKDGAMKTIGRLMLLPVTGPFKIFRALTQFLLRDDAADAEYIDDNKESAKE
jgi:putative hemolysin